MCHARSAWWLETTSYARRKPRHRLASLGNPKKKKCSLPFLIFAGVIFSKMERTFFFLGFCPPSIRAVWRGFNADEVLAKLFFGERVCQNFGSFVFEFGCRKWKRRGLGRNFPFAPLFVLGEFGADNFLSSNLFFFLQTLFYQSLL